MVYRLVVRFLLWLGLSVSLYLLFAGIQYPWNWRVPWEYRQLFFMGFYYTLLVSLGSIVMGFMLGVAGGLARVSRSVLARELATLYVEVFRGTPLLVQIYVFYFCIAAALRFDNALIIGMVTLAFFSGAYISEMVRAGIESIDKGQVEAAKATGLDDWQTMRYIIFPQALKRIIPPVTGQFVSLIKDSSLPPFGDFGARIDESRRGRQCHHLQDIRGLFAPGGTLPAAHLPAVISHPAAGKATES